MIKPNSEYHGTWRHRGELEQRARLIAIWQRSGWPKATASPQFGVIDFWLDLWTRIEAKGRDAKTLWIGAPGARGIIVAPWLPVTKYDAACAHAAAGVWTGALWHTFDLRDVALLPDVAASAGDLFPRPARDHEREGNRDPVLEIPIARLVVGWPKVIATIKAQGH